MDIYDTIYILAGIYYGFVAVLLVSWIWQSSRIAYNHFYSDDVIKTLSEPCGIMNKQTILLLVSGIVFVSNCAFVTMIAFDKSAWNDDNLHWLQGTLAMQIAYYVVEVAVVPLLNKEGTCGKLCGSKRAHILSIVLMFCAALQIASLCVVILHGTDDTMTDSQIIAIVLNGVVVFWATGFDFLFYTLFPMFGPSCNCVGNKAVDDIESTGVQFESHSLL